MLYFILIPVVIIAFATVFYIYEKAKMSRMLRYTGVTEGRWISKLIATLMPVKNSRSYIKLANRIYYLDSEAEVETLYFWKIVSFLTLSALIAVVMTTNVLVARENVYTKSVKINGSISPVNMTKTEFKQLSKGLVLVPQAKANDLKILEKNVLASDNPDKFSNVSVDDVYVRVSAIDEGLKASLGAGVFLTFILLSIASYFVPNILLTLVYKYLDSVAFYEFIKLETLIYLKICTVYKMDDIIEALINNAVAYRELFRSFLKIYEKDPELAFNMVAMRREFPKPFVMLITYLHVLESDGERVVKDTILTNKRLSEEDIAKHLKEQASKRKKILVYVLFGCFIASLGICIPSVVAALDTGALTSF